MQSQKTGAKYSYLSTLYKQKKKTTGCCANKFFRAKTFQCQIKRKKKKPKTTFNSQNIK